MTQLAIFLNTLWESAGASATQPGFISLPKNADPIAEKLSDYLTPVLANLVTQYLFPPLKDWALAKCYWDQCEESDQPNDQNSSPKLLNNLFNLFHHHVLRFHQGASNHPTIQVPDPSTDLILNYFDFPLVKEPQVELKKLNIRLPHWTQMIEPIIRFQAVDNTPALSVMTYHQSPGGSLNWSVVTIFATYDHLFRMMWACLPAADHSTQHRFPAEQRLDQYLRESDTLSCWMQRSTRYADPVKEGNFGKLAQDANGSPEWNSDELMVVSENHPVLLCSIRELSQQMYSLSPLPKGSLAPTTPEEIFKALDYIEPSAEKASGK